MGEAGRISAPFMCCNWLKLFVLNSLKRKSSDMFEDVSRHCSVLTRSFRSQDKVELVPYSQTSPMIWLNENISYSFQLSLSLNPSYPTLYQSSFTCLERVNERSLCKLAHFPLFQPGLCCSQVENNSHL